MQNLTATRPILYRNTQYQAGDILPAYDPELVSVWIEFGSAIWTDDAEEKPKKAKAKMVAEAGETGTAVGGETDETGQPLVGKLPKTKSRKKS